MNTLQQDLRKVFLASALGGAIGTKISIAFGYYWELGFLGAITPGLLFYRKEIAGCIPVNKLEFLMTACKFMMGLLAFIGYVVALMAGTGLWVTTLIWFFGYSSGAESAEVRAQSFVMEGLGIWGCSIIAFFIPSFVVSESFKSMKKPDTPLWILPFSKRFGMPLWKLWNLPIAEKTETGPPSSLHDFLAATLIFCVLVILSPLAPLVGVCAIVVVLIDCLITVCVSIGGDKPIAAMAGAAIGTFIGHTSFILGYADNEQFATILGGIAGGVSGVLSYWARIRIEDLLRPFAQQQFALLNPPAEA